MTHHHLTYASIIMAGGLTLAVVLPGTPAMALQLQTYVSGHGSDNNPCTYVKPCRTFGQAIKATANGGVIYVLDPAQYGVAVVIDKSLSIINDGVGTAGILVPSGGTGITITAATTDGVVLRGLTIDGGGTGTNGIQFNAGKSLTIDHCFLRHFSSNGINFFPNTTSDLIVSNTVASDNGSRGIFVSPSGSGVVTAVFDRILANTNGHQGILVDGSRSAAPIKATVSEGVAGGNGAAGFAVTANGPGLTMLKVYHSVAANNATGISANNTGATLIVAESTISGNARGWAAANGGVIKSYGDNYIDGNGSNTGSLTPIASQ